MVQPLWMATKSITLNHGAGSVRMIICKVKTEASTLSLNRQLGPPPPSKLTKTHLRAERQRVKEPLFLAVQNSSIGDLVTDWVTDWVTFWFWHYRVTLETCDLWDIWSEWWRNMTWPTFWQFFLTIFEFLFTFFENFLKIVESTIPTILTISDIFW